MRSSSICSRLLMQDLKTISKLACENLLALKNTKMIIDAFKNVCITFCMLRQYCFYLISSIFNNMSFHVIFIVLEFPSLLILASLIEKSLNPWSPVLLPLLCTQILFLVYLTSHINGNSITLGRSWIPLSLPPCPMWTRACFLLM